MPALTKLDKTVKAIDYLMVVYDVASRLKDTIKGYRKLRASGKIGFLEGVENGYMLKYTLVFEKVR